MGWRRWPEGISLRVERYSEHPDRVLGGDFGAWRWEVAAPFDSLLGTELVMRVPDAERATHAVDAIQLDFDPAAADGHPKSRAAVHAKAPELTREQTRGGWLALLPS